MIVCCCKGISSQRLAELIANGADSLEAISAACGAGTDCGSCRDHIEEMVEEAASAPAERKGAKHLTIIPSRAA